MRNIIPGNHTPEVHPERKIIESWVVEICKRDTSKVCIHLLNEGDKVICAKVSPLEAEWDKNGGNCLGVQDLHEHEEGIKKLISDHNFHPHESC